MNDIIYLKPVQKQKAWSFAFLFLKDYLFLTTEVTRS